MADLKLCPFCGSEAMFRHIFENPDKCMVGCRGCDVVIDAVFPNEQEAAKEWNDQALASEIAALKADNERLRAENGFLKGEYERLSHMPNHEAARRIREHNSIHQRKEPNAIHITDALEMAAQALEDIEAGRLVRVPHKVGDKVHVISNCQGVRRSLDGTMYSCDGSPGTATGYYCAYDENWDECPLAKGREECDEKGCAVFEDTISAITICLDDENEGPCVYIGLSNVAEYRDNKIYGTDEAARAALEGGQHVEP